MVLLGTSRHSSFHLNEEASIQDVCMQRTFSDLHWKSMATLGLISASPARQLSSMVHLVTVVRCSTAQIVLLFAARH